MAVYTHVPADEIARLLAAYGLGPLVAATGIAEGIENSNYRVEAAGGRFVLTLYERRVDARDLPFFLALLDHLADRALPVPRALRDRGGRQIQEVRGRPACLIEFRPGLAVQSPTAAQARAAGEALGAMHRALADFAPERPNALGVDAWRPLFARCESGLDGIAPGLRAALGDALDVVLPRWPADGVRATIHADLFPDNVLMVGDQVTGLIDFYFACTDLRLYDLAIAHSAWAFDAAGTRHDAAIGGALLAGYAATVGLSDADRAVLPVLAMGACLRFALTRALDWLHTPADAMVTRKDPLAYMRRLTFYRDAGDAPFR